MANKLYDESAIQNIAIAIRSVDGTENTYSVSEMSGAIMNLSGGATLTVEETVDGVKITATDKNGTTTATILYDSTVTIEETDEGVKITATDKNGTTSAVVKNGTAGKSAHAYAQDGGYTGTEAEFAQKMSAEYVPLNNITLGVHTDGLVYVFVNNSPVGTGVEMIAGDGDLVGYVDSENNIVVKGNLADGTYSVKYEMEDEDGNITTIDIGDLDVDTNVYYSVTNTLTNCTNSNSATEAVQGESYAATITANDGFELSSVVVTMGGTDVSASAVSGGSISIAEVTGNIVITAVAEETVVEIVNQIPLSIDTDGSIYNGIGYKTNTRIRGTGEVQENYAGASATGFIAAKNGDVVYLKGIAIEISGISKVHPYDASKTTCGTDSLIFSSNFTDEGNGVYSCTLTNANTAFIRVASNHIMDGTEIVTINQPIV